MSCKLSWKCGQGIIDEKPKFICSKFNTLMDTIKPQSNGPLCSNMVIGTLATDAWAVAFGTARRGLGGPLLAVPKW